jgi:hypothetical protein
LLPEDDWYIRNYEEEKLNKSKIEKERGAILLMRIHFYLAYSREAKLLRRS